MVASRDWSDSIAKLMAGSDLSDSLAHHFFGALLDGELEETQISAVLVALAEKGVAADELDGALKAMLERAVPVTLNDPSSVIDTCGTGGDRSGSINVSTIAAFVLAGGGVRVCKHGNKAASSLTGSADVLDDLGVAIDLDAPEVAKCVKEVGMGFCFAPRFHPALGALGPIRRSLGIPTIFNYLGPLANPAGVGRQLIGVNNPDLAPSMIEVLRRRGLVHAIVVHGHSGLDEFSLSGPSHVWELNDGQIKEFDVTAGLSGLEVAGTDALRGGDATHNAQIVHRVLDGEPGAYRDVVVLNAGVGFYVADEANSIEEGVELARKSIDGGSANEALNKLIKTTQALAV